MSSERQHTDIPVWSIEPRTGYAVEKVAVESSAADVDTVVRAAAAAASALDGLGNVGRAVLLRDMADALEADTDQIVDAADRETALGAGRLRGELARSSHQLRLFAEVLDDGGYLDVAIDHADPGAIPAPRPDLRRMLVPLGVVGVFGASNFPLAFSVPGGDTASAFAAGCPVVVKAHPAHPLTAKLCAASLRRAIAQAGLPEATLGLVFGHHAGELLVAHPLIRAVGFTGSLRGGRALYDLANARPDPIPFFGELSSLNPVVITPGAAATRAAEIATGLAASFTAGAGQFCTKPGLALLPADDGGRRIKALLADTVPQTNAAVMLTENIRAAFVDGVSQLTHLDGVEVIAIGEPNAAAGAIDAIPTLLATTARQLVAHQTLREECFGPVLVLAEYRDEDELLAAIDSLEGSLTATVHASPAEEQPAAIAGRVATRLLERAGRLVWNGYPTGVAVTWAMQHGGPYPASTAAMTTSVGTAAIQRFLRPVAYQSAPESLLPAALRDDNPLSLPRRVNGQPQLPTSAQIPRIRAE